MNSFFPNLCFIFLFLSACDKDEKTLPNCIEDLIEAQKNDVGAVYRYLYQGEVVYDFNPIEPCCDFANPIYTTACIQICMLNGLIGNQICRGDTFYLKATDKTLVWKK